MRVRDGAKQTVGLRLPVQLELSVNARHDEIEAILALAALVLRERAALTVSTVNQALSCRDGVISTSASALSSR
jgi:hypothetical protein